MKFIKKGKIFKDYFAINKTFIGLPYYFHLTEVKQFSCNQAFLIFDFLSFNFSAFDF